MQQNWVGILVAIALVVQLSILAALFFTTRRTMQKLEKTVADLNDRAGPILTRVQILLDDTQPKISTMVSDAAHIVYLARGQAQKVDRVFTDAADRLRGQLLHVDRILTGTMEAVEDAGSAIPAKFLATGAKGVRAGARNQGGARFAAVAAGGESAAAG
jgi:hypothetical protein